MTNSWPEGYRHAIDSNAHLAWNASHYPGTRQLCTHCEQPTGRCEEDSICSIDGAPICRECSDKELLNEPR
jgi:hypothetical protein